MPVYNEKDTILEILARVLTTDIPKEVIIVDDDSKDGTREILENIAGLKAKGGDNSGYPGRSLHLQFARPAVPLSKA